MAKANDVIVTGVHFMLIVREKVNPVDAFGDVKTALKAADSPITGLGENDFGLSAEFGAITVRLPSAIPQYLWERIRARIGKIASIDLDKTSPPALTDYHREKV